MFEDYCLYVRTETPPMYLQFEANLDSNNFTIDMIDQAIGAISKNFGIPSHATVEFFGLSGSVKKVYV